VNAVLVMVSTPSFTTSTLYAQLKAFGPVMVRVGYWVSPITRSEPVLAMLTVRDLYAMLLV